MAVDKTAAVRELRRECGESVAGEGFGISGWGGVGRGGALTGVMRAVWERMEGAMAVEHAAALRTLRRECGEYSAGEGFGISGRDGVGRGGAPVGVKREVWERIARATAVESAVAVRGLRRQYGKFAVGGGFGSSGRGGVCRGGALTGVKREVWERMEGAMAVENAAAVRGLRRQCGKFAAGEGFGFSGQDGVGRGGALTGVKRDVWERMERATAVEDAVAVRGLRRQCGEYSAGEDFGISGRGGVCRGGALVGVKREVWERMEEAMAVENVVAVCARRREYGASIVGEGFGSSGLDGVGRGGALTGVMRAVWERIARAMAVEDAVTVRELLRECGESAVGEGFGISGRGGVCPGGASVGTREFSVEVRMLLRRCGGAAAGVRIGAGDGG